MKVADSSAKKKAKEVTPKQEKIRTILNWVMTAICIVMVVFALVVAIFTIVRSTNGWNLTMFGDKIYMNVMSSSMEPTFDQGDVIIVNRYKGDGKDLKVGQVITFCMEMNGLQSYNTHRIIYIERDESGAVEFIKTRGDNQEGDWRDSLAPAEYEVSRSSTGPDGSWDPSAVLINTSENPTWTRNTLIATWGTMDEDGGKFTPGKMLKGVGAFANWIQDNEQGKTRFFCVIVLPLILLFIAYAFVLVRTLVIAKLENNKKVKGEPVRDVDAMSDEEKRRLAQELLASLSASAPPAADQQPAGSDVATTGSEAKSAEDTSSDESAQEESSPAESKDESEQAPADESQTDKSDAEGEAE